MRLIWPLIWMVKWWLHLYHLISPPGTGDGVMVATHHGDPWDLLGWFCRRPPCIAHVNIRDPIFKEVSDPLGLLRIEGAPPQMAGHSPR